VNQHHNYEKQQKKDWHLFSWSRNEINSIKRYYSSYMQIVYFIYTDICAYKITLLLVIDKVCKRREIIIFIDLILFNLSTCYDWIDLKAFSFLLILALLIYNWQLNNIYLKYRTWHLYIYIYTYTLWNDRYNQHNMFINPYSYLLCVCVKKSYNLLS
jgi:hypothetical protein